MAEGRTTRCPGEERNRAFFYINAHPSHHIATLDFRWVHSLSHSLSPGEQGAQRGGPGKPDVQSDQHIQALTPAGISDDQVGWAHPQRPLDWMTQEYPPSASALAPRHCISTAPSHPHLGLEDLLDGDESPPCPDRLARTGEQGRLARLNRI